MRSMIMTKTKLFFSLFVLVSMSVFANKAAAADFHEGFEYFSLQTPQATTAAKGTIEVVELFWYRCGTCYRFEPFIKKWLDGKPKNVTFVRIPALLENPGGMIHARAYYTALSLKVVDKVHQAIFDAVQKKKGVITSTEIKAVFIKNGVKAEDFDKTFASAAVTKMIANGKARASGYHASGVPTMIVAGKYKSGASLVDYSFKKLMVLVDFLVQKEMSAKNRKKK